MESNDEQAGQQTEEPSAVPAVGVSRRDFLRKAGTKAAKEAVNTGTYLVPGGAIARRFLEGGEQPKQGEDTPAAKSAKPSLLGRLAGWRQKRTTEEPVTPPTETQGGAAS